ncbi:MAG: hypothetical protein JSW26_24100 [Desulfobacterales bacterium]|nr:MAG: hypothetical protein JSW26_24100 [Desulfobacterales bacterium]
MREPTGIGSDPILPAAVQIKAWRKAGRQMGWSISDDELADLAVLPWPALTDEERNQGFVGTAIFYGFGVEGSDRSDAVLSGKLAWKYACRSRRGKTWQCEYIDFKKPEDIRLRPGAPVRPRGFYFAKIQLGKRFQMMTVNQLRKTLVDDTGLGPEGFQLLAITHPHLADWMSERKTPFMALADYDVAPHGFNDFFDAPQLFCSNRILGLGIGNVDRNYPLFGIPTLQFCKGV